MASFSSTSSLSLSNSRLPGSFFSFCIRAVLCWNNVKNKVNKVKMWQLSKGAQYRSGCGSTAFRLLRISYLLGQRNDILQTLGSWRKLASMPLYDLSLDLMDSGVWQFFRADCTVILRYCKSKSGKKYRSYCTLNHQRILNLQFALGLRRRLRSE